MNEEVKERWHVRSLVRAALLLSALAGPALGQVPASLPTECHDRALAVMAWAIEGRTYDPRNLDDCRIVPACSEGSLVERRACTVAVAGRHASGNWPVILALADVMAGHLPVSAVMPFLRGGESWGLNGIETGSLVYLGWNTAAVMAFLDWALRNRRVAAAVAASRWLEAEWAYLALQATRRAPARIRYKVSDRPWSDTARRNEWRHQGPFAHTVGDRSEAGAAYASISQVHYLLGWALGERRRGRVPVDWHDDVHWPLWVVARISGAERYTDEVAPRVFGLQEASREALVKFLRNPTEERFLPPVLELLEGYPLLRSSIRITRFANGETLSVYAASRNGATMPAIHAAWSEGEVSSWVSGSRHTKTGAAFGSHTGYCRPRGPGLLECGSEGDAVAFQVEAPSGPAAWEVVIDSRGARRVSR